MPNHPKWKFPCIECAKPVKSNQKGIECSICIKWVHLKCTNLAQEEYDSLENNANMPFYCLNCKPRLLYTDAIPENTIPSSTSSPSTETNLNYTTDDSFSPSLNDSISFSDASSANSSDFVYVDESDSDSESLGLNFESLPVLPNTLSNIKKKTPTLQFTFTRTINYKYPCSVCLGPCKEKIQDSICCTLCDEWVHRKCTDLTLDQFKTYCSPDHAGDPFYCANCLFGNCTRQNQDDQICLSASDIELADINDTIQNICPNSVFRDKENTQMSDYYTMDELNVEIKKTPDDILLIHINAVSLCKNIEAIIDRLAELKKQPSILFISETKVQDSKLKM